MSPEVYAYRAVTPQELELSLAPSNLNSIKELADAIPNFDAIGHNIVPSADNQYELGSSSHRWKSIHIGEGTIYITDSVTGATAELTISDGIFFIDGIAQAQLPNLHVTTLHFQDGSTQTTAPHDDDSTHLKFISVAPLHDHGQAGHKKYDAFIDDNYFYVCHKDYVNNSTNIWYRMSTGNSGQW